MDDLFGTAYATTLLDGWMDGWQKERKSFLKVWQGVLQAA